MRPTPDDTNEQLHRIERLLKELRAETAASQEEAKVVSESMAERATEVLGIAAFRKRAAESAGVPPTTKSPADSKLSGTSRPSFAHAPFRAAAMC
ncbi:MAG: hypothetical protein ACR2G6_02920 [Gemmatimonadaceae bacterium]